MHDVKVKDVMTNLVVTMAATDTVQEAAARLARNGISGGPVLDAGKVVGVVSEADLIRAVMPPVPVDHGTSILDMISIIVRARPRTHEHVRTVGEVMNPMVVSIGPDQSIWDAAHEMERRGIKRLPVVDDDGYLLGIVSRADLVKTMARSDSTLRSDVLAAIGILGAETISALDVEVTKGIATVQGTADRRSTRELALRLASRVPGIVQVIDNMDHERDVPEHATPKIDPRENWNADIARAEGRR
jgi:CBS domain-containing protein